ncbi:hypothetical protein KXW38_000370 [Aspergillus fumigatus]|nr:hypothetical protein KXW38_000370 [Aspergillus fumigatus]
MFEIEFAFLGADLLIGALENGKIERFLVADMVVKHALVGAGLLGDAVDPRAADPMGGKFLLGSLEDAQPHALRVALPSQNSLSLGQLFRSVVGDDGGVTRLSPFAKSAARDDNRSVRPRRLLDQQGRHAAGAALDRHHARAGPAADAHFGDIDASCGKPRVNGVNIGDPPADAAQFVGLGFVRLAGL